MRAKDKRFMKMVTAPAKNLGKPVPHCYVKDMPMTLRIKSRLLFLLLALAALLPVLGASLPAWAQPAVVGVSGISKPLVVIRFNQRKVNYEQSLYMAVSQAVSAKPDVVFDLVSYVPNGTNPEMSQKLMSEASVHLREVADNLVRMGIPAQRLNVTSELEPSIRFDEVHVFVR